MTLKRNKQRRERSEDREARVARQQQQEELDEQLASELSWPQHDDQDVDPNTQSL